MARETQRKGTSDHLPKTRPGVQLKAWASGGLRAIASRETTKPRVLYARRPEAIATNTRNRQAVPAASSLKNKTALSARKLRCRSHPPLDPETSRSALWRHWCCALPQFSLDLPALSASVPRSLPPVLSPAFSLYRPWWSTVTLPASAGNSSSSSNMPSSHTKSTSLPPRAGRRVFALPPASCWAPAPPPPPLPARNPAMRVCATAFVIFPAAIPPSGYGPPPNNPASVTAMLCCHC